MTAHRWTSIVALAAVSLGLTTGVADARQRKPGKIPVLTHNLYMGTDLVNAIQALSVDPGNASPAINEAWLHVEKTDFHTRAKAIAAEVRRKRPAVIAFEEAVWWRTDTPANGTIAPPDAGTTEYDFVADVLAELRARHLHYSVAVVADGNDIEVTHLAADGETVRDLRLTDRSVILVKKGVRVANAQSGRFAASVPLPIGDGFSLVHEWASIDATYRGRTFRFVATHIEDMGGEDLARAQVGELLAGPLATTLPVILAGDFNADASQGVFPGVTGDVLAAGFTDAWATVRPGDPGNTWGQSELLDNPESQLSQRLDYVFTKGALAPVAVDLVGEEAKDRIGGLWPSDHAGLFAVISIE